MNIRNSFLFSFLLIHLISINFTYCQNNNKINISYKNQVGGIVIKSTASTYIQNRITVSTSITNINPNFIVSEVRYKIILKGKRGQVLKDTLVEIKPINHDSELLNIHKNFITVTEINGKVIYDTVENPEYFIILDKLYEKDFKIKPKGVYVSSLILNQKNISSILVFPTSAGNEYKTYYAPGY